jgi:hypothetical protein
MSINNVFSTQEQTSVAPDSDLQRNFANMPADNLQQNSVQSLIQNEPVRRMEIPAAQLYNEITGKHTI